MAEPSKKRSILDNLQIDPNALDLEWLQQPTLYFRYAQEAAEARKDMDSKKLALDVTLANVQSEIRKEPEKYGIAKVTEGALDAAVKQDTRVDRAQQEFLEAKNNVALLEAAVASFEQKKRALENLVQLHLGSYFAGPKIPHELEKDSVQKWKKVRAEQAEARIAQATNKKGNDE